MRSVGRFRTLDPAIALESRNAMEVAEFLIGGTTSASSARRLSTSAMDELLEGDLMIGTGAKELIALMSMQDLETLIAASSCTRERLPGLLNRTAAPYACDREDFLDPGVVWYLLSAVGGGVRDEFLGLGNQRVSLGSTELMVARALQEPTLGEAISAFARATNILWPDLRAEAKYHLDELHFCLSSRDEYDNAVQIFLELASVPFFYIFQWITDSELPILRFRTASNRPSDALHLLALLDCGVQFEGEGVDIIMPKYIADIKIVKRCVADWRSDIFKMFQNLRAKRRSSFSGSRLQHYVLHALRSGVRSQQLIAGSAGISVATLRRNLAKERTSFRELHDLAFRESVGPLLSWGEPMEQIADRMGYADSRSFRRAFYRVFGTNPSVFRERLFSG